MEKRRKGDGKQKIPNNKLQISNKFHPPVGGVSSVE
jgi:hypothetical protein